MPALLLAMRNRLRASLTDPDPGLAYAALECEVGWDGKPQPISGQVFLSVHPGAVSADFVEGRADTYQATVTLSMRLGGQPVDRWGVETIAKAMVGLYARADAIAALLHRNEKVRQDANIIINAAHVANGFVETQRFEGFGIPQEKGPDWWFAEGDATGASVGLALEIRFGECRRYQTYESQT